LRGVSSKRAQDEEQEAEVDLVQVLHGHGSVETIILEVVVVVVIRLMVNAVVNLTRHPWAFHPAFWLASDWEA
jgi:hypothetical protein